jgi:hypothetical protein
MGTNPVMCAADNRQNGDGNVVVDGELSNRKELVFFDPADPGRSCLESSILPLYVYLLPPTSVCQPATVKKCHDIIQQREA